VPNNVDVDIPLGSFAGENVPRPLSSLLQFRLCLKRIFPVHILTKSRRPQCSSCRAIEKLITSRQLRAFSVSSSGIGRTEGSGDEDGMLLSLADQEEEGILLARIVDDEEVFGTAPLC